MIDGGQLTNEKAGKIKVGQRGENGDAEINTFKIRCPPPLLNVQCIIVIILLNRLSWREFHLNIVI